MMEDNFIDEDDDTLLGEVSLRGVNTNMWLVKVPKYVSTAWDTAEDDSFLGKVRIYRSPNPDGGPKAELILPSSDKTTPEEHNIVFFGDEEGEDIRVFSKSDEGHLAFEGRVERKCDVKPASTLRYRTILKSRYARAKKRERVAQVLGDVPRVPDQSRTIPLGPDGEPLPIEHITSGGSTVTTTTIHHQARDKRDRVSKEELQSMILTLFEKHEFLSLKDLIRATEQPVVFLKEVLGELTINHKRGSNKNFYELKEQYRLHEY